MLTTPLAATFEGVAEQAGITLRELGEALERMSSRDGVHPLHELECGRMTEIAFVDGLQAALSAFVGMRKPDAAIYALTVARLGVPAAECLSVDDREDNCAGAIAAGMRTVRFVDNDQAIADIRALLGTTERGAT